MNYKRNELKVVFKVYTLAVALVFAGCGRGGGGGRDQGEPSPQTYTLSGIIQAPDNALMDSDVKE